MIIAMYRTHIHMNIPRLSNLVDGRIEDQPKTRAFDRVATAPDRAVCQSHLPSTLIPDETRALATLFAIDDGLRQP
jgi:hypothetical protein